MTPPDSDEREVGAEFCTYHGGTLWPCANCIDGILNPAMYVPPPEKRIALPLSLAQRILAALEGRGDMAERYACADELRERMGQKP